MYKDDLTPREEEVIKLVVKGYSDKEIMDELHISLGTKCSHMHSLYQKFYIYDGKRESHRAKRVRLAISYIKEHKELLDEL